MTDDLIISASLFFLAILFGDAIFPLNILLAVVAGWYFGKFLTGVFNV